jgi:hypothetical protein
VLGDWDNQDAVAGLHAHRDRREHQDRQYEHREPNWPSRSTCCLQLPWPVPGWPGGPAHRRAWPPTVAAPAVQPAQRSAGPTTADRHCRHRRRHRSREPPCGNGCLGCPPGPPGSLPGHAVPPRGPLAMRSRTPSWRLLAASRWARAAARVHRLGDGSSLDGPIVDRRDVKIIIANNFAIAHQHGPAWPRGLHSPDAQPIQAIPLARAGPVPLPVASRCPCRRSRRESPLAGLCLYPRATRVVSSPMGALDDARSAATCCSWRA